MRNANFILMVIAAICLIPAGLYYEFVYPDRAIIKDLEADGITDVKTSYRMFSGTMFTRCNDKHATVRSYTGLKDGRYTSGVACYATFWGATHWAD